MHGAVSVFFRGKHDNEIEKGLRRIELEEHE
jgi:hypothetical protein